MPSIDLSRFNLNIIQNNAVYCIPASVQAMLQFNDQSNQLDQDTIMNKIIKGSVDGQPSFRAAANCANAEFPGFTINQLITNNYDEWVNNIKHEINDGYPIAISTRTGESSVHIRVVLSYDDTAEKFQLFDPGVPNGFAIVKEVLAITIKSGLYDYSYLNAKEDYLAMYSCKDQLTIRR